MVRGRYESITCARHRVGSAFDGRGFGNGHEAAQTPWVKLGYWSIELTRIEHSSKELDGHIRQGPDVGGEHKGIWGGGRQHLQSVQQP
jgi:hypothetical protein